MLSFANARARLLTGLLALTSAALVAVLLVPAIGASARDTEGRKVLEFETMAPVQPPFVGAAHKVRGLAGGGAPWVISSAEGELSANGNIEVHVRGLVLDPSVVPAPLGGTNPIPQFLVIVSCLTNAAPDDPGQQPAATAGPFPATTTGNMDAESHVDLPRPCVAPVIFVTAPTRQWFAVTGVGM
jgi:hypothetical protein